MGFFDNVVSVVIDNKIVQSIKTTDGGVIYENGNGTVLTIDVPLNLVYSDAFNITGTLKDSNQTGLSGETVKLKVGNTVVDSTTTTTGGAYSFTQTPVATGNHSFQVVYEGSVTYNASQSSIVNRVVGKETTVLTVANPTDNYMTYDSNISFTGRLTDDEGNPLSGKTISINGAYVTYTVTTQSDGSFSTSKAYGSGTWNFTISFEGDSNYTSSSVNRSVMIREHDYDISISADKPILSYSDEDSCTVTCLLTDNHVAIEGETLSYTVKHGATVLDSGSDTTDANGEISFTYTATGVGDVTIEVDYSTLLQETFVIQDCWYYSTTVYSTGNTQLNVALPSAPFSLEYIIKQTNSNYSIPYLDIGDSTNNRMLVGQYARAGTNGLIIYKSTSTTHSYGTNPTLNQDNTIYFRYDGSNYYYKLNNGSEMTVADANVTLSKLIHIEGGQGGTLKNIKVKAL